ncbi:MAG TPA: hypothetical protein VM098_01180 [Phycisphaerae bacterium]|nr:hypothetical protein [Phycisphaerae bacterium]
MFRRRKMLGLAVTGRSITAVEVVAANAGGRSSHAAEFVFADGAGLQEPVALGKALKQFLHKEGFSASRCVIGMEASWLTAREKTLPPGAGASVVEILSLMVEREYAADRKELVFDYALGPEAVGERSALLVAAPRRVVNQLTAMAAAAGLTVTGMTASTMVLAGSGDGPPEEDQLILHLYGGGAELAIRGRGGLRMMRRLPLTVPADGRAEPPSADGWLRQLTDEMRRVIALLPGGDLQEGAGRELLIWDETRLDPAVGRLLSEQLALPVRVCESPEGLEPGGTAAPPSGAQFSAAAAMALGALRGRPPAVDLLHSRLAARKTLAIGSKVAWAAAVVAALVVAGTVLALDWRSDRIEAAAMETKLNVMADDLAEAKDVIAKVTFARPWYDRRPSYLDCMRELTLAFPQEGIIWTTSLGVQEDMRVVLSGRAVSETAVLDVLDKLKASPKLSDVMPLYIRQADRQGREVAFAMSLTFIQSDETWSSPSAKKPLSRRR